MPPGEDWRTQINTKDICSDFLAKMKFNFSLTLKHRILSYPLTWLLKLRQTCLALHVISVYPSPSPSIHPPMLVWEWRGYPVDTVNPVAKPRQDGGQRKTGGRWKDREAGGREGRRGVFVFGLAYLDWFQPQQQPVWAPALHPLSSPQHPDLITQPCDSGLEPRGLETERWEGRERGETDRERLDFMSGVITRIYQFHFQSNRAKFGGWRFVSNHLSAQFIKHPQRLCSLAEPMGVTQGQSAGQKPSFCICPL